MKGTAAVIILLSGTQEQAEPAGIPGPPALAPTGSAPLPGRATANLPGCMWEKQQQRAEHTAFLLLSLKSYRPHLADKGGHKSQPVKPNQILQDFSCAHGRETKTPSICSHFRIPWCSWCIQIMDNQTPRMVLNTGFV